MPRDPAKLTKTDKTRIELWTAHDMVFVLDKERGQGTIPRFTACVKPVYTNKIKAYLANMERQGFGRPDDRTRAVAVKLEGQLRYVWRTDVLTKEEYDAAKEKERTSLSALRSKPRGTLDQGGQGSNGDQLALAAPVLDGERDRQDD